ncbi:IclR family transcriptional regulator domain-containing protein [Bordetella pertussis]
MGVHFGSRHQSRPAQEDYERQLSEIRSRGISRTLGSPIPGIDAFCAPVFDSMGHIAAGLLVMGPSATFDSDWDGQIATRLHACANDISRKLGYIDTPASPRAAR